METHLSDRALDFDPFGLDCNREHFARELAGAKIMLHLTRVRQRQLGHLPLLEGQLARYERKRVAFIAQRHADFADAFVRHVVACQAGACR
jgi:hypothetical protein